MKVSTWQKDMRLIADELTATDTAAPLFAATLPIYNAAMALGHGGDDTAAVYAVLERWMREPPTLRAHKAGTKNPSGKRGGKKPGGAKKTGSAK